MPLARHTKGTTLFYSALCAFVAQIISRVFSAPLGKGHYLLCPMMFASITLGNAGKSKVMLNKI